MLYFPEKFLSMGSPDVVIACAKGIGIGISLKAEKLNTHQPFMRKKIDQLMN